MIFVYLLTSVLTPEIKTKFRIFSKLFRIFSKTISGDQSNKLIFNLIGVSLIPLPRSLHYGGHFKIQNSSHKWQQLNSGSVGYIKCPESITIQTVAKIFPTQLFSHNKVSYHWDRNFRGYNIDKFHWSVGWSLKLLIALFYFIYQSCLLYVINIKY